MAGISDLFIAPSAAEYTARTIQDALHGAASFNRATLENVERIIWVNPWGMTPQEVFDLLGTKAAGLLALKAAIIPLLVAAASAGAEAPHEMRPEGVNLRTNEDGTVTVVEV